MELVVDRSAKEPASELTEQLVRQAFQNGLLLLSCGKSTIRFMPPLMVSKPQIDEAISILSSSIEEVRGRR
jgi:4-aminobutyrate aminotransferase